MRNRLPKSGPHDQESAIVNLDDVSGPGTHWVAYCKLGNTVLYFDSFGDLRPPIDVMLYSLGTVIAIVSLIIFCSNLQLKG